MSTNDWQSFRAQHAPRVMDHLDDISGSLRWLLRTDRALGFDDAMWHISNIEKLIRDVKRIAENDQFSTDHPSDRLTQSEAIEIAKRAGW